MKTRQGMCRKKTAVEETETFMVMHSIPVIVLASLSMLVGLLFFSIYLRNAKFQISGSFALVCLAVFIYDIGCIGLYNATDVAVSVHWQRLQFAGIAAITAALALFYNKFSGNFSGKIVPLIAIVNLAFCIATYALPGPLTLSASIPAEKSVEIGNFIHIRYFEGQVGIINNLQMLFSLVVFTVCNIGLIKFFLRTRSSGGNTAIVIGMNLFYLAGLNDAFVSLRIYPSIYLFEYSFAGLIVSMAMMLVGDFVDLVAKYAQINQNLEAAVEARTKELKTLSGLLPICASCKKIRDDHGYWNQIESFLLEHSDATFSHSICPECSQKLYPELAEELRDKKSRK